MSNLSDLFKSQVVMNNDLQQRLASATTTASDYEHKYMLLVVPINIFH